MKANYPHDCTLCKFLGTHYVGKDSLNGETVNTTFDLYFCNKGPLPTIIARYGIDGNYHSGMQIANYMEALFEAKKRSEKLGLI